MSRIVFLMLAFSNVATAESIATPDSVAFSRSLVIKTSDGKAKDVAVGNVELKLKPFNKGPGEGFDGWDRQETKIEGVRVKSEIHVVRTEKSVGEHEYYIYMMLRSGEKTGKIKKFRLREMSKLKSQKLTGDRVKLKSGGTLQATLTLGPKR